MMCATHTDTHFEIYLEITLAHCSLALLRCIADKDKALFVCHSRQKMVLLMRHMAEVAPAQVVCSCQKHYCKYVKQYLVFFCLRSKIKFLKPVYSNVQVSEIRI